MKVFYENRTYQSDIPASAYLSVDLDFMAHCHDEIEMIYVCEGSIGVGINSEYKVLGKGGIAICGSNDIHYYKSGEGLNSKIMIIIFRPEIFGTFEYWPDRALPCSVFMDQEYLRKHNTDSKVLSSIKSIFKRIVEELDEKKNLYTFFTRLMIIELFVTLYRYFPSYLDDCKRKSLQARSEAVIRPMQKAIKYLEENYTQDITLEQLAEEVNLSSFYLSRLFKKTTGMNFNSYLTRVRVDKAEAIIKATSKTILEIAYDTGFNSIRTFNRSFKAFKGCTPGCLRQQVLT